MLCFLLKNKALKGDLSHLVSTFISILEALIYKHRIVVLVICGWMIIMSVLLLSLSTVLTLKMLLSIVKH